MHCYYQMRLKKKSSLLKFPVQIRLFIMETIKHIPSKENSVMIPIISHHSTQLLLTFCHFYFIFASLIPTHICLFPQCILKRIPGIVYLHCKLVNIYLYIVSLLKICNHKSRIIS